MADVEMPKEEKLELAQYDLDEACRREKEFEADKAMRTVLSELATAVRNRSMTEERAYAVLEERYRECGRHRSLDYWVGKLERYIKKQTTPRGALADYVIPYVEELLESLGGQQACVPYWVRTPVRRKMYVTTLVLGADGRQFMFAYNAISKALGTSNSNVHAFIEKAKEVGFLCVWTRGEKYGMATRYCLLNDSDREAWKDLGKVLGNPQAEKTASYIQREFSWMFDRRNYMNSPAYISEEVRNGGIE